MRREAPCEFCGFTSSEHEQPIPPDWFVDPAAYPCDEYTVVEEATER